MNMQGLVELGRWTSDAHRNARRVPVLAFIAGIASLVVCATVLVGCTARSDPKVIGDVYTGAEPGSLGVDGDGDTSPTIGWVEPGQRFYVMTYGSSSCPSAPTALRENGDVVEVKMAVVGGPACTKDFGPSAYALDLPKQRDPADAISVTLQFEDAESELELTR